MVNAYCEGLDEMFNTLAFFNIIDPNDAQCFQLKATVEAASWLLVTASLLLAILSHFVLTASSQKILDENMPVERRRQNDRWSSLRHEEVSAENGGVGLKEMKQDEQNRHKISPLPPRFTDYYSMVTRKEQIAADGEIISPQSFQSAATYIQSSNVQLQLTENA